MNRHHIYVFIFGFLSLVSVSLKATAQTPQELITEIKMNPAYLTATGTSHSNGEAMKDARSRLKYEIFNWLTEMVPPTPSADASKQAYRNQIAKSVKLEEGYKRLTYTDTLNAYSMLKSQSDEVKFIDRKVGDYLRVFAYLPKSKVLPGLQEENEISPAFQEITIVQDEETVPVQNEEAAPAQIKISSYIDERETPNDEEKSLVSDEIKTSQQISKNSNSDAEAQNAAQEVKSLTFDEGLAKELAGIKTAADLNALMGKLKQSGKLGKYGNSLTPDLTCCYIVMFDSHKIVRERLWYNGKEMINLSDGTKADFTSLYDSYPNIIWFQTK